MTIKSETNYRAFKFIKGNRPIVESKVKKLIEAVEGGLNLFQYCPVLVNKEMYVIDGQHRLEACKRLKLPVYYCMVKDITLAQIAKLNSAQNKWKIDDFFNCFIETGNKEYKTLHLFAEKWSLSTNVAAQLMMNGSVNEGGGGFISDTFREGLFVAKHPEQAHKIIKAVYDYQNVIDNKLLTTRAFIGAIQSLLKSPDYDHKAVVEKLTSKNLQISKKATYKEYIYHIEELFNKGNSIRKIIYSKQSKTK